MDLKAFWDLLRRAPQRLLMLDYDGTLAPFRVDRAKAFPYPGVRELLEALQQRGRCRLVLVSGRAVEDLIPLLGLKRIPEIWGSHGMEYRGREGRSRLIPPGEAAIRAFSRACDAAIEMGLEHRLERKPGCLALHWRGLSEDRRERIRKGISGRWSAVARGSGLELREFDGGLELRVAGRDKGRVVEEVLADLAVGAAAAYLGDDETDEDAFRAIKGRGLSVLVRPKWRPTEADIWIKPPGGLLRFLRQWLQTCMEGAPPAEASAEK